jgi:hypothetical protein
MTFRPDDPVSSAGRAPGPSRRERRRGGFSILEAQVAFVLLGIGLAGVCPLIVMQVRLSTKVATGFDQNGQFHPGGRSFLVPQDGRWSRKLGAAARLNTANIATPPPPLARTSLASWSPRRGRTGVTRSH